MPLASRLGGPQLAVDGDPVLGQLYGARHPAGVQMDPGEVAQRAGLGAPVAVAAEGGQGLPQVGLRVVVPPLGVGDDAPVVGGVRGGERVLDGEAEQHGGLGVLVRVVRSRPESVRA